KGERKENGERERERERGLIRSGTRRERHEGSEWEKALCNCNPDKYPEPRRTTNEQREMRERERERERERRNARQSKREKKKEMKGGWCKRRKGNRKERAREKEALVAVQKLFGLLRNETKRNETTTTIAAVSTTMSPSPSPPPPPPL
ncbi:hypothetical protein ALC57_03246, partial [Trachymyrmex cornetzi]